MENIKEGNFDVKKIFFITSNINNLDKSLKYEIPRHRGLVNLRIGDSNAEFRDKRIHRRELFSVYINSMEIEPKELKKEDQNIKTRKYTTTINLNDNRYTFKSSIVFNSAKNNFIFDFEFKQYNGWVRIYNPPPHINLSKQEQLKLYVRYLKEVLGKKPNDQIFKDLMADSIFSTFGTKIYLDFFLEILKNIYTEKESKLFLKSFKLENILLPKNFLYKEYAPLLQLIEDNPKIILQYYDEKEDKRNYYLIIYSLILFVRFNYQREKAIEMVENKNLWEYVIQILPDKFKFFRNLNISDELLNKMFDQELSIKIISGILCFCGSIEKILVVINNKIELISKCCLEENKQILMSSLETPKKTDNLEKIIKEIEKIIKYEMSKENIFISFDEEFWKIYIKLSNDLKSLIKIKQVIIICSEVENKLKRDNMELINKIHSIGLKSIKNITLKNEDLIEFINLLYQQILFIKFHK